MNELPFKPDQSTGQPHPDALDFSSAGIFSPEEEAAAEADVARSRSDKVGETVDALVVQAEIADQRPRPVSTEPLAPDLEGARQDHTANSLLDADTGAAITAAQKAQEQREHEARLAVGFAMNREHNDQFSDTAREGAALARQRLREARARRLGPAVPTQGDAPAQETGEVQRSPEEQAERAILRLIDGLALTREGDEGMSLEDRARRLASEKAIIELKIVEDRESGVISNIQAAKLMGELKVRINSFKRR